ncbi:MAG: hypothetical protein QOJ26_521 [Thermoplasmata archaeon]|nr:hypothetical protein [Thermoplasmata archaeon]
MVGLRPALPVSLLVASLLAAVPPVSAQDGSGFLLLGEDAVGDPSMSGVPMIDTWIDINGLAVATIGTDLVFHLGLEGVTTEAGSYCWMVAFEFDGTEYVGLDCYEGLAYESDNSLSGAVAPDTSRGANVASSVVFDETGALITIPIAAIGASMGDVIEDIYGLTYATRALNTVDTVPDAKTAKDAEESLGTYRIGGPAADDGLSIRAVLENLTTPFFLHEFTNATSDDYTLNFTLAWTNATLSRSAEVVSGSANVTLARNGEVVLSLFLTNKTAPALANNATFGNSTAGNATLGGNQSALVEGAAGNWTVAIDYEGFVGHFGLGFEDYKAPAPTSKAGTASKGAALAPNAVGNATAAGADAKGTPAAGAPLVALMLAAMVAVLRRRDRA